ncbi:arsenate reductase [Advenella kashmirensis W13003]|uniref:Arsenate reductase n=1 Tax=Advenella kashmirensis W13003 TaxID=1424334 RepID=V8QUT3_9BURK|nr:arsenate reductase (glutaredoxin) [Advenella kashmirensis]ETF03701.1 arsenate reductase [Advenella kashmirensis W13003]
MDITIYHNTRCGTSRTTLALIRNTGVEPDVIEYLHNPPTRAELESIIEKAGISVREAVRQKETLFKELGLDDPAVSDARLLDAMIEYPILINRPFVLTPKGARLCRPAELVLDILPLPQKGALNKEDGTPLIDALGQKVVQA